MIDRLSYFRSIIFQLRIFSNLTQKDLAEELGIHPLTYSRYERGFHPPSIDFLLKVCDFYDVSLDYLFGYE